MNRELVKTILEQTETLLNNLGIMLRTCDMEENIYGLPVWKHVYHTLHSLDRWFINPEEYTEPPFHEPELNSLDVPSRKVLSKELLMQYFEGIKAKIPDYLAALTDDMLTQRPDGCPYTRLALVLGQFRHTYAHLGIINGSTIRRTGKWPRVIGLDSVCTPEDEDFE